LLSPYSHTKCCPSALLNMVQRPSIHSYIYNYTCYNCVHLHTYMDMYIHAGVQLRCMYIKIGY
jgi:hypothetical protein